jgi:quercetin dioxygenase-like cupin family protein
MTRMYILILALVATGFLRSDAAATRSAAATTRCDAAVMSSQDPLVVNAKTIALRLENARVRVLEATLKPGDKENTHSHPAYVIYVIAGGKVRTHGMDGSVTEAEFKSGDVIYRDAVKHWAENIGTTTIRLELVELKE